MSPKATVSAAVTPSRSASAASADALVTPAALISTSPGIDQVGVARSPTASFTAQRNRSWSASGWRTSSLSAGAVHSSSSVPTRLPSGIRSMSTKPGAIEIPATDSTAKVAPGSCSWIRRARSIPTASSMPRTSRASSAATS